MLPNEILTADRDHWRAVAARLRERVTEAIRLADLTPLYGLDEEVGSDG